LAQGLRRDRSRVRGIQSLGMLGNDGLADQDIFTPCVSAVSVAQEPTGTLETALAHASRLLASEPALAEQQAMEIIRSVGGHPEALRILASSHSQRGDDDRALEILEPLAVAQPRWALVQLELGLALGRAGRGEQALLALRRAVALKPELPQAWRALADHLSAIGDSAGADAAYAQHLRHSIRDPQLLAAASALCENQIPRAMQLLRDHLKQAPSDVAALRMLAEASARLGRLEDAETLLEQCLKLAPGFDAARQNYAMVLHRSNKPREALLEIETLLAADPRNPGSRNLKAVVLCRIGDYQPAIDIYAGILEEYPQHAKIWLSYGHALKTAGQSRQSIQAYRRSIELDPGFGEAWWSLANLKTFRFDGNELAAMRQQLDRQDLPPEQRCQFDFAIAKALEDAGDYPSSMQHYLEGNALRRKSVPYSAEEASIRVRRSTGLFTREFFQQRADSGTDAADPIFIVGLPRSGSTLIEQILSCHSRVEGTMELPEIISMTRELRQLAEDGEPNSYHHVLASLDGARLRELGEQYLERTRVHRKTDAPMFIDKMPNNFFHVGLIHLALPKARIIDARRHPLACCFSGFKQYFARGQNFSYGLDDIGRYYCDYVELMAHYDAVLPGRIHRVVYERMVEDTEAEVRRLLDYCGLPFEPQCLRFFENERPVRTASSEQVRQPIYRDGIEHWRNFEPWLGPLKAALGPILQSYPGSPALPVARI